MVRTKPKMHTSSRIIPQTIPMIPIIGNSLDDDVTAPTYQINIFTNG